MVSIDVTPLFAPLEVRGKRLRNRIVMPPMVTLRNLVSPDGIEWYSRRARGGVALVIVEATSVNRFEGELTADGLRGLVGAIHAGGALAAIQLFPVARGVPVTPAQLSTAQLDQMVSEYERAAEICAAAGFDGIEPHGAHGFVLNQFFSPEQNTRTDEYGGTLENRMRLARRIVRAVRHVCGDDMMVLYRHTPEGPGYGIAESLTFAEALVADGVDILDLSPSSIRAPADHAAPFRALGVPVIAVNELDRVERALEALAAGRADLIAVGRGLIADPDWPTKVREGRFDEIIHCIRCNEKCFGNLERGLPIECSQWSGAVK